MNDINFKSLIVDEENTVKPKTTPKKKNVIFEQITDDDIDFAIRKTYRTSSELLVVIVSEKQYYIKNENTNEIRILTSDNLTNFLAGNSERIKVEGVKWIKELPKGKAAIANFFSMLEKIADIYKEGLFYYDQDIINNRFSTRDRSNHVSQLIECLTDCPMSEIYRTILEASKKYLSLDEILDTFCNFISVPYYWIRFEAFVVSNKTKLLNLLNNINNCQAIYKTFGKENMMAFICSYYDVPVNISISDIENIIKYYDENDFDRFKDYCINEAVKKGNYNICSSLSDYYHYNYILYGKITEKFPENLLEKTKYYNNVYDYIKKMWENINDEYLIDNKINSSFSNPRTDLDWDKNDYTFTTAQNCVEIAEEMFYQQTDISKLDESIINGTSHIVFMRKVNDPHTPFITIKICNDSILAIKAGIGSNINDEANKIITEWITEKKLNII